MHEPTALDYAREWSQELDPTTLDAHTYCAAKTILDLPDEWVDADKIRDIIDRLDGANSDDVHATLSGISDALRDLLPTPKPRTLADMNDEERQACQFMQFAEAGGVGVILKPLDDMSLVLRAAEDMSSWGVDWLPSNQVTPLPDKEPMGWPGNEADTEDSEPVDPADSDYQRDLRELRDKLSDTTTSFDPAYAYRDSDSTVWRATSTDWECDDGCCFGYATPPAEYAPYTRIDDTEDTK